MRSNIIHIYYGFCDDLQEDSLPGFLSQEELKRAHQIQGERQRSLYLTTRAALRSVLADYLAIEADTIQFQYGLNGKPFVKSAHGIHFSVSHSNEFFMLGFTRNTLIGVDVESLTRPFSIDKLSGFLFSDKELQKFKSSDRAHHSEHFVNSWTRKEAVLKAKGSGFTIPPNQFEVSFLNDEMPSVLSTMWSEQEHSEWFLKSLDFPGQYRGAVAVQGEIESIEVERITSLHSQISR